jgi:hypothetical protein
MALHPKLLLTIDVGMRSYLGALFAAPFAYYSTIRMMWNNSYHQYLNWSAAIIFGWSIALWFGAILIGIPAVLLVVSQVTGFWKRTAILTVMGAFAIFLLTAIFFGPYAIFAPLSGGFTALACCLFNSNRLKRDHFEFWGKVRGVEI